MTVNYLFVYGTLKPGGEAHYYLARMHGIWSDAYCYGNWVKDSNIGYPVISLDDNGEKIKGKLFFSKQLKNVIYEIDKYEGSKYKRSVTNVYLDNGSSVKSYVYEAYR